MVECILYILVGLPRSGKSSWARTKGLPIVNPDSIRLALHGNRFIAIAEPFVWAITYLMARALFLAGNNEIIIDATNTTLERRVEWENSFKDADIRYVYIDTPKDVCIKRAIDDGMCDLVPVIESMAKNMNLRGVAK